MIDPATASAILAASRHWEQAALALILACCGLVLVLGRRWQRTDRSPLRWDGALTSRQERSGLAVILLAAALARLLWCDAERAPRWWPATADTVKLGEALAQGDLWTRWLTLLTNYQVDWIHESAAMAPIAVAFQAAFGPSVHVAALNGAFWGLLAVFAAWRLGRLVVSPGYGLVFAGLVAFSPMQMTWSRLGGLQSAASAQVLLVLWLSYGAGRRRTAAATILAAVATWATLYHYYAARVAGPLALVALISGTTGARDRGRTIGRLLAVFGGTLALLYVAGHLGALLHGPGARAAQRLWPDYSMGVGNQGERSTTDLARSAVRSVSREMPQALGSYFWSERTIHQVQRLGDPQPPAGDARSWGMRYGGLCLAPIAVLGLLGVIPVLGARGRGVLWIAFLAAGLAIPTLSITTSRRLLVFDVAWCALAAHGLTYLLDRRALAGVSPARRQLLAGAVVFCTGAWAFTTVAALQSILPTYYQTEIPFGESGPKLRDARTCLGCIRRGFEWQAEMEAGAFVVLVDSDFDRENLTIPGALPIHGALAALVAKRPDAFLDFYTVALNFERRTPFIGQFFDASRTDFTAYLIDRIRRAAPATILWHFEQPTQWEEWLARRLEAAGGTRIALEGPSLAMPGRLPLPSGFAIRTPWAARERAFSVLETLATPADGSPSECLTLRLVVATPQPTPPLLLGASQASRAALPDWAVGRYTTVEYQERTVPVIDPVGIGFSSPATGPPRLRVLDHHGRHHSVDPESPEASEMVFGPTIGLGCAAFVRDTWWVVDPITGALSVRERSGAQPDAIWTPSERPLPSGPWIGVATHGDHEILLASADQRIHIFDVQRWQEVRRFAALVPPSRRHRHGECSLIASGDGWIATLNHLTSLLAVYDQGGRSLATIPLFADAQLGRDTLLSVAGQGSYLGIGRHSHVQTIEMTWSDRCGPVGSGDP